MNGKPSILIVDDRESWRLLCGAALELAGFRCGFAEDAVQAVQELRTGHYSIVSLNFNLKKPGQLRALLGRMHSDFPRIAVLIITGSFSGSLTEIYEKAENLMKRYPNIRRVLFKASPEESQDEFVDALLETARELALESENTTPGISGDPFVTWLHLSDFHFKAGTQWDTKIVLEHLLEDIENRGTIDLSLQQIDLIFVTGDVGFSGKSDQYDNARPFLHRLRRVAGVRKDRVFLVPGNHDVDRDRIPAMIRGRLPSDRNSVNEIYQDAESRIAYLRRFEGYRGLINSKYKRVSLEDEDLFYVKQRTIKNHVIRITGLNSAWVCEEDGEYGKLILGDIQVREALKMGSSRGKADLSISLLHHPLDWLNEFDQADCRPLCYGEFDFLLHGHLHRTGILSLQQPGHRALVIGAGACYLGRDRPNAYNYVCLNVATRRGTAYFREYTDMDGGHWTRDTRTYKAAQDGTYDFSF